MFVCLSGLWLGGLLHLSFLSDFLKLVCYAHVYTCVYIVYTCLPLFSQVALCVVIFSVESHILFWGYIILWGYSVFP